MSPPPAPSRCTSDTAEPTLGLPVERATALLPADLLQGDEVIILLLKPSLWFILLTCLESLAALALIGSLAGIGWYVAERSGVANFDPRPLWWVGLAIAAACLLWQFLQWISHVYVLTNRRVIRVKNFIRPMVFDAPLTQLQHTELVFSLRERLFGLGTIAFSTAGTAIPEAAWWMINRPMAVHRKVIQTIKRAR
jgi:hypothetical protein